MPMRDTPKATVYVVKDGKETALSLKEWSEASQTSEREETEEL